MPIAAYNTKIYTWLNVLQGWQLFSPIALLYFAQITGSYAVAGSIFSSAYIAQIVFEVPTGILSDRIGRTRTITLGACAYALSLVLYATAGSWYLLLAGAVLEGVMRAFYSGNNQALLYESDQQDGENRYHHSMAESESYFHIAATVSAVIGGMVATHSFRLVYALSIVPAILAVALTFKFIEPKRHEHIRQNSLAHIREAITFMVKNRQLRIMSLASSLEFGVGHTLFGIQLAYFNTLWPLWAIGISRALSGLFAAVSFRLSGTVIDKLTERKTLILSGLWSRTVSFVGLIYPTAVSPFVMSLSSLTFGPMAVAQSTLEQKNFNAAQRATLGSISSVFGSFVFAVMSVSLGSIADKYGLRVALISGLLPLVLSSVLIQSIKKQ